MFSKVIQARRLWSSMVERGNVRGVVECYSNSHIFKGTLNNHITNTEQALEEYFTRLTKKTPKILFTTSNIENISEDTFTDTGKYTFVLKDDCLFARYIMTYKVVDGETKIISHYSYLV